MDNLTSTKKEVKAARWFAVRITVLGITSFCVIANLFRIDKVPDLFDMGLDRVIRKGVFICLLFICLGWGHKNNNDLFEWVNLDSPKWFSIFVKTAIFLSIAWIVRWFLPRTGLNYYE